MDILLTIILGLLCYAIGCALGEYTVKKANRNPGQIDGYIAIDHDNGQFNLFAGFNQEPSRYLHDGQIVKMEVVDLTGQAHPNPQRISSKSQEKQRP